MDCDSLNWTVDYYYENKADCDAAINALDSFDSVPLVIDENLHSFKDGDLVRFHGLVQDLLPAEYYFNYYLVDVKTGVKSKRTSKFLDVPKPKEHEEIHFDGFNPEKRLVYFCIPIPYTNDWVKNHVIKSLNSKDSQHKPIFKQEEEDCDVQFSESYALPHEELIHDEMDEEHKTEELDYRSIGLYFPSGKKNGLACFLKVYEECEDVNEDETDKKIFINDIIEIIGFIRYDPSVEDDFRNFSSVNNEKFPSSVIVPRIHALRFRKLNHINPILNETLHRSMILECADKIRGDLHFLLTQFFCGDSLAADYMICYLLSKVYNRFNHDVLGKLSLNLYNVKTGNYARRLYEIMETIVTNSQYIPLSLEFLNAKLMNPRKNYKDDRLISGSLQLAKDTYLLLDETQMKEGKLEHIGCVNVKILQTLIDEQEVPYNFKYYDIKYSTSSQVLVLSEGKSFFKTDIHLKVQMNPTLAEAFDETFNNDPSLFSGEILDEIRKYLTLLKLQTFEISEDLSVQIGEDYVNLRQKGAEIGANDLNTFLLLARYLALSHGRTTLAREDWSRALEMESERKAR